MKKTCYLHIQQPSISHNLLVLPLLWMQLETYYHQVSPYADQWEWIVPDVRLDVTIDEIIERLTQYETLDVVGISHYVWDDKNEVEKLQTWVKEHHPSCIVVLGGPQQDIFHNVDFFKQNPHLDLSCDPAGYGEVFWTTLLDQLITTGYNPSQIPFATYPGVAKLPQRSSIEPNRREIIWPIKPYHRHEALIDEVLVRAKEKNHQVATAIEFSRGCPYSCTFCEWGGTGTKVVFKPMDLVENDLSFVVAKKIDRLYVMDANFGIVKRDVDIVYRLGEFIREYQHTPHVTFLGYAKNDKKYVNQIIDICAELGLIDELNVSMQSLNADTLKAVKRIDAPWREQLQDVLKVKARHPEFIIRLQNIVGLPLSTIDDAYALFDVAHEHNGELCMFMWHLLPSTPAYAPSYIERYAIRSVNAKVLKTPGDSVIWQQDITPRSVVPMPIVVETSTMSFDDFIEIYAVSEFVNAVMAVPRVRTTLETLHQMTQLSFAQLYKSFANDVLKNPITWTNLWYVNMERQIRAACEDGDGYINVYQLPTPVSGYFNGKCYWDEMFRLFPKWMDDFRVWVRTIVQNSNFNSQTP